jgi:hypothetical protein
LNISKILKISKSFEKYAAGLPGKDYIKQTPSGILFVDGIQLDRDALNAMKNWQDMVDMGVPKSRVGEIAREYGGHPKDVDVWLEQNSTPYIENDDDSDIDFKYTYKVISPEFGSEYARDWYHALDIVNEMHPDIDDLSEPVQKEPYHVWKLPDGGTVEVKPVKAR